MKFTALLSSGKEVLRGVVHGAAALEASGILNNVPIVDNILKGCRLINGTLEGKEQVDDALAEVKQTVELVSPIVAKLSQSSQKNPNLQANLDNVNGHLESIWDDIEKHLSKWEPIKYATSSDATHTFTEQLEGLRKALDALSFTLTGETFVAVLRTEGKIDNIGLGVYATQQMTAEINTKVEGVNATLESMNAQMQVQTVQKNRDSAVSKMEIDEKDIDWFEESPFAEGSFGAVYRVKYERNIVVAKKISLKDVPQKALEGTIKEYKKEVGVMGGLRSQNTVQILGSLTRRSELVIVMEYCAGGDLRGKLDKALSGEAAFRDADAVEMLLDVAFGMKYLHQHNVIHKDLKSLNVLIDSSGRGKVSDFGGSQSANMSSVRNSGSAVGTYAWAAPEVLEEGFDGLTAKADVYAFGIIIWECLTYKKPWEGLMEGKIIKKVGQGERPEIDESMNDGLRKLMRNLMEECWNQDPKVSEE